MILNLPIYGHARIVASVAAGNLITKKYTLRGYFHHYYYYLIFFRWHSDPGLSPKDPGLQPRMLECCSLGWVLQSDWQSNWRLVFPPFLGIMFPVLISDVWFTFFIHTLCPQRLCENYSLSRSCSRSESDDTREQKHAYVNTHTRILPRTHMQAHTRIYELT